MFWIHVQIYNMKINDDAPKVHQKIGNELQS